MPDDLCSSCGRWLAFEVAWTTHRGGPTCRRCMSPEVATQWYDFAEARGFRHNCEGECGRLVLDTRNRGQTIITCSSLCRHRYWNDMRRMERRAKLGMPPPGPCAYCGADLWRLRRSDQRYCSAHCRVRAYRQRMRK